MIIIFSFFFLEMNSRCLPAVHLCFLILAKLFLFESNRLWLCGFLLSSLIKGFSADRERSTKLLFSFLLKGFYSVLYVCGAMHTRGVSHNAAHFKSLFFSVMQVH